MKKFYLEILVEKWNHAGTKARSDVALFLDDAQVDNLVFDEEVSRLERILFRKKNIRKKLSRARKGDMIIISHRIFFSKRYADYFMKVINEKELQSVLLIHDVESLRQFYKDEQIQEEMQHMNLFDVVISHNEQMTKWLVGHGVTSKIVNLDLFDYFNLSLLDYSLNKDNGVVFAGNLEKSTFLSNIKNLTYKVSLFGPNPGMYESDNVTYFGSFPPSELPNHLKGSFGLIWDGDSVNKCTGITGEYLKYNNPHKTSLYISCGLPVIIWKEAAMASFIEKNKLGFSVNSLEEIDEKLANMTDDDYRTMKNNTLQMAQKVRTGYFIKEAIKKAEIMLKG